MLLSSSQSVRPIIAISIALTATEGNTELRCLCVYVFLQRASVRPPLFFSSKTFKGKGQRGSEGKREEARMPPSTATENRSGIQCESHTRQGKKETG
mmetsp:Transcript_13951/g.27885  ORF Transcript_13951/g.27885 Transcript_13951/m.27885 type:complete len:97 (+) Transcript_13951:578-868(+)